MTIGHLVDPTAEASRPITALAKDALAGWLDSQPSAVVAWIKAVAFRAEPGEVCVIPGADGEIERVLLILGEEETPWSWASLPHRVPPGRYRIDQPLEPRLADAAAVGWGLATYRYERYRRSDAPPPSLLWPEGCDRAMVARTIEASVLARDLINTPAGDLGPAELAAAVEGVAGRHHADFSVIVGDDLLPHNYPLVHAVGRASVRAPRLIDLRWGDPDHPRVTLVGKGVCFDSGGLDLKPAAAMKLMKKDMGGAAIMLALADMVMSAALPVRLRLLIPAVENSVGGSAFRPLDIIRSRAGSTVEIGNTDAEGRLILADALSEAVSESPHLLIDCATLTGAARVALGPEIAALFSNDDALAAELVAKGAELGDPLWRLPLWPGYRRKLDSRAADLTNAPDYPFAGAILAALFLQRFVTPEVPWAHVDVMAWNVDARPGRPRGGEATALRALAALVTARFGG